MPRPHRVLGGAAQLVLIAFAHRGGLLGEQVLVADGLRLGVAWRRGGAGVRSGREFPRLFAA